MRRFAFVRIGALFVVLALVAGALAVAASPVGSLSAGAHGATVASAAHPPVLGPTKYVVTFTENQLPANLTWQVSLGSSTASTYTDGGADSVAFFVANGVYNYRIYGVSGWQQSTLPYRGTVTVSGAPINETTVVYTQVTYAVTFAESGVPAGQTFAVTVAGNLQSLTTDGGTDSLAFQVPNGTSAYQIHTISGWQQSTLPYHGSVVVSGSPVTEPTLLYTQVTYSVSFSESGIVSGLTFGVTLNSVLKTATTTNTGVTLSWSGIPNGSYPYSISRVSGWQQSTLPQSGNVVVAGSSVAEPTLQYTKFTYPVEFSESGLPVGQTFQVTVGSNAESLVADGGTDTLIVPEPNGTYAYVIGTISGWYQTTLPYHGTIVVASAGVTETTVNFTEVTYSVTYTETGLPVSTNWSMTLNGATENTTGTQLSFTEPNGSFAFKVGYVAGYATTPTTGHQLVNGANVGVTVPFSQVKYIVTFTESGLPNASLWSVSVNSHTYSSSTTAITVSLPNGTFDYSVPALIGYVPASPTGSVVVNGANVGVAVPFNLVTYTVTFTESGLPTSHHPKAWTVSLNNEVLSSTGTSIVFAVGNGTYTYLVRGPGGFRVASTLPPEGTIVINGASASESVTFLKGSTGSIVFHETGLGAGTHWCVTIGARLCATQTKLLLTDLTPGTYTYVVRGVPGLQTLLRLGKAVLPTNGTLALSHSAGLKVAFAYKVTFTESGLPADTAWKVSTRGASQSATTTSIVLYLVNGSYLFHVGKQTLYASSPSSGAIKVAGAPLAVSIAFTPKH